MYELGFRRYMTPKRRFLAALYGGRVDRPAVGSATSVATVELMDEMEASFPEAHLDPSVMARLASGACEVFHMDNLMPVYSVTQEAAALGCHVNWGSSPDEMPEVRSRVCASIDDDVKMPDDFLAKPPIRVVLDAIRLLRKDYGDHVSITGKALGPWSLALSAYGVEEVLIATIDKPERLAQVLRGLKEVTLLFGRAQIEAGADSLCIPDHVTADLCRPEVYSEYLLPIHFELQQQLDCPLILHICGHSLDRLKYIAQSGMACFHYDTKVSAKDARRAAGDKISLMGGVNNPSTLLFGSPEAVAKEVHEALDVGIEIIGPECAVPLRTPNRNLKAIALAVDEYVARSEG